MVATTENSGNWGSDSSLGQKVMTRLAARNNISKGRDWRVFKSRSVGRILEKLSAASDARRGNWGERGRRNGGFYNRCPRRAKMA